MPAKGQEPYPMTEQIEAGLKYDARPNRWLLEVFQSRKEVAGVEGRRVPGFIGTNVNPRRELTAFGQAGTKPTVARWA